jgi:cation:H+ antiporter
MFMAFAAVVIGLILLVWSADRFVDGAAASAGHFGISPLLIGMVIIGFGTSAPELVVSVFAAAQGNPGVALGNAYGSNMTNIGLVLGLAAALSPITVSSQVIRKELPILIAITAFAVLQLHDADISRTDAVGLLLLFFFTMAWAVYTSLTKKEDALTAEFEKELKEHAMPLKRAIAWLVIGLLVLIVSSRLLVWGAVAIATDSGVSEVVIGLTIVAIGTSLPEVASTIAAVRKREADLAIGNVIGSNMFNTLAVVGLAGAISPMSVDADFLRRDIPLMCVFTLTMFFFAFGFTPGQRGRVNRVEGVLLLVGYLAYLGYLVVTVTKNAAAA